MGKKRNNKENWETILKYKQEYFDAVEFEEYNPIHPIAPRMTSTPYVKNKKKKENVFDFVKGIGKEITVVDKEIEICNFTPKPNPLECYDEKSWLEKSVNIFNSAVINRTTIVLEKNKDKVKLSIFKFAKSRKVGHRYFAKYSEDLHITFNTTTKNFFITNSTFLNRKRITSTTKNDFAKIVKVINKLEYGNILSKRVFLEELQPQTKTNKLHIVDLKEFFKKVEDHLCLNTGVKFNLSKEGIGDGIGRGILSWFIKVWKIKVPNHYYHYLLCHYPGIRNLRKYKMNLGRAVLGNKELNGKYYIKLINEPSPYNLTDLKKLERLLGARYAKMVPKQFLRLSSNYLDSKYYDDYEHKPVDLTKYEKLNLIKVLGDVEDPHFLSYIDDHITTKNKLKGFGVDVKIKCKNKKQFNEEHHQWADLVHLCERNKETIYHYDPTFLESIEKPITHLYKGTRTKYEIKILRTDLEYFNEGQYQHHCVRTYLDRYDSIIISVRRDHTTNPKRMTVEFGFGNHTIKDYSAPRMLQAQLMNGVRY